MNIERKGLWKHSDFLRLWSGQTISQLGSWIGGTAMSFTAVLFLQASPLQMSWLSAMEIAPAILVGLFAGAWVDRLRRRPLMITADLGRALVLASIPLAAAFGLLHIGQVLVVAFLVSVLAIFFDLAYQSYLPGLVGREHLLEGNSKLSASAAAAEFGGFSIAGWLVQALGAPMAVLIDALSFIASALSLGAIRAPELPVVTAEEPDMRREIAEGWREVLGQPLLRASAGAILIHSLFSGVFGALVVLYMSRGLGFNPGVLSMIWAVGGVSSLVAASLAPAITRKVGMGRVMIIGLTGSALSAFLIPIASGATLLSAALLIAAQLADGLFVIYEINLVSLRQGLVAENLLGRVNASLRILGLGAALAGALLGGAAGEVFGVRAVLFAACFGFMFSALPLVFSPIRSRKA